MTKQKYPRGWNEARVRRVLEYYESQSDEEAAAEIDAGFKRSSNEGPFEPGLRFRVLISIH